MEIHMFQYRYDLIHEGKFMIKIVWPFKEWPVSLFLSNVKVLYV